MKHLRLFEDFKSEPKATPQEVALLGDIVKEYVASKSLDVEDESSLLAVCHKLDIKPTDVYKNHFIKNFSDGELNVPIEDIEENNVVSDRTEAFMQRMLCAYINKLSKQDEPIMISLLDKLDLDYDDAKKTCGLKK